MALPQRYTLTIHRGATLKRWFALRYPDGAIADPTTAGDGYTDGRLVVRDTYSGSELLNLTTENGGVTLGLLTDAEGRQWSGFLFASAAATATLVDWGDGVFTFEIGNGSDVIRVAEGVAILSPETTT